jgi:hypothetical protein
VLHVPFEIRKALPGFKNSDITTHCSTPELEGLFEAASRVCGEKFGMRLIEEVTTLHSRLDHSQTLLTEKPLIHHAQK